jgi:threonine/homoserine/homoserine lactone efflux protein
MDLLDAALAGALAGYGVAIPVGAIAILIIETAARRGPRVGAAAGLGAATADGIYATGAGLFGGAIAAALAPLSLPLRAASVVVLAVIGGRGLLAAAGAAPAQAEPPTGSAAERRSARRTYLGFLGLTILNPMTVAYFAALVLGLPAVQGGVADRLAFAIAAFAASASWQLLIAGFGGLLHRHASPTAIRATSVIGNVVILGFAALIAQDLLAG